MKTLGAGEAEQKGSRERECSEGAAGNQRLIGADRRRGCFVLGRGRCRTQAPPLPASTLLALLTVIDESEPSIVS